MPAQAGLQQRLQSIERLLAKIESAADPSLRADVQELVQLVMDLHGAGIERALELIRATGDSGESFLQKLGRDELVSNLLVLYGLHPLTLEARLSQALDKVGSRLRAHKGEVELLSIDDGAVRLRLHVNGHGCGSNAQALQELVEAAVYQAAPDVTAITVECVGEAAEGTPGFVPLQMLQGIAPAASCSNGLSATAAEKGGR